MGTSYRLSVVVSLAVPLTVACLLLVSSPDARAQTSLFAAHDDQRAGQQHIRQAPAVQAPRRERAPALQADAAPAGRGQIAAQQAPAQTYSVDAAVVFEKDGAVHYSLYGHNPRIPISATQPLTWAWWSLGDNGASDPISRTRPLTVSTDTAQRPAIAFSREGFALAAWGTRQQLSDTFGCTPSGGGSLTHLRYRGSIRPARLVPAANGDLQWQIGAALDPPANTANDDQLYSNPAVAIDNNGTALVVWMYTKITHNANCTRQIQTQVLFRRWEGADWVGSVGVVAPNPNDATQFTVCTTPGLDTNVEDEDCGERFTDLAFTARLATDASPTTRQQAIAVWNDFITTTSQTCTPDAGTPIAITHHINWPRYAVWNGAGFSAPAGVPGGPLQGPSEFFRPGGAKLGISGDQRGNAELVFPVRRATAVASPTCTSFTDEVWDAQWPSSSAGPFTGTAKLLTDKQSPDVAFFQMKKPRTPEPPDPDEKAIAIYQAGWATKCPTCGSWTPETAQIANNMSAPTVAALAHEKVVAVWIDAQGVKWAEMHTATETWSSPADLITGSFVAGHPEIAARSGSPTLPLPEWTYVGYFAADNNLHPYIARDDRGELRQVGSTALINVVVLVDPLDTWDSAAWKPFNLPGAAPPNPFPDGNVKYQYLKRNGETDLRDLGEQNSGSPNTLTEYLAWVIEHYPANRYVLDLADHGQGWRKVCEDWRQGDDWLTMPELRDALTAIKGASSFRWNQIVFSACEMAQLEVAYQIRDLGSFMVSSEELMPGDGPNYVDLLNDFIANPFRTDRDVARQMVTIFQNNSTGGTGLSSLETLSAVDLSQIDTVATRVSAFATALNDWLTDASVTATVRSQRKQTIQNQRNAAAEFPHLLWQLEGYSADGYRDLDHFAQLVISALAPDDAGTTLDDQVRSAAQNLRTALATAVIQSFADSGQPNARGLSIYLEDSSAIFARLQNAYTATLFARDILTWTTFISNQAGASNTVLRLTSPSPFSLLRVQDSDGKRIGIPLVGSTRCSTLCGTEIVGGRCVEPTAQSNETIIAAPETTRQFTWLVDGALLTANAPYTLTIQSVIDGVVAREQTTAGTVGPAQVISGQYGTSQRLFLPFIANGFAS